VRALIAALIGCCGLAWGGPQAIAANYLIIDLVVEPEHLPKFACVLVANPPACGQKVCSVAISKVRGEAHSAQAMAGVDIAPESQWQGKRPDSGSELAQALRALTPHDGMPLCQDEGACPLSITTTAVAGPAGPAGNAATAAASEQYLDCAINKTATGSLVAVLDLRGTVTTVTNVTLEGSRVGVSTSGDFKTTWVTSAGGHYAPGLSQPAVQVGNNLQVTVPLVKRCQERTVQLPIASTDLGDLDELQIREADQSLLTCRPDSFAENNITLQMPIGREGIARSLAVRPRDGTWEAVASWSSRTPPETLKLWWKRLSFTVRPDCILPAPATVEQPDACPAVAVPGAKQCTKTVTNGLCQYTCTAVTGAAIVTPASVSFSYAGMEWTDTLVNAFSTMVARPPSDVRRLYFSTWHQEEIDAIVVRGPRGFEQRIQRDFQGEGPYAWLSMPGLQCNDTVSYEYEGRFDHREMPQILHAHPLLVLDPPEATWRYPITLHVGGGAAIELDRPAPFLAVGARFGGPFEDLARGSFLGWRSLEGTRVVWQVGAELELTSRSYDPLTGTGVQSVAYQRQLAWWGIGYSGFRTSPTFLRTILPTGGLIRIGVGHGVPVFKDDRQIVGSNDLFGTVQLMFHRRFSPRLSGEGGVGLLLGEAVRDYARGPMGETVTRIDTGWHAMRFMYEFQLTITP
jgi:hypothetical protein